MLVSTNTDYEYKVKSGFYRLEAGDSSNWVWRYFPNIGDIISSNNLGEFYRLKREAKEAALEFIQGVA